MTLKSVLAGGAFVLLAGCTSHPATPSSGRVPPTPAATDAVGVGSAGGNEAIADFRHGTSKPVVASIIAACSGTPGVTKVLPPLMRTGPAKIPTVTFELGYYEPRAPSRFFALRRCLMRHPEVTAVLVPM